MCLMLKVMSAEDMDDHNPDKAYALHSGLASVTFERHPTDGPVAFMLFENAEVPERISLTGNAYVMNADGKTVSSFSYVGQPTLPAASDKAPAMLREACVSDCSDIVDFALDYLGCAITGPWSADMRRTYERAKNARKKERVFIHVKDVPNPHSIPKKQIKKWGPTGLALFNFVFEDIMSMGRVFLPPSMGKIGPEEFKTIAWNAAWTAAHFIPKGGQKTGVVIDYDDQGREMARHEIKKKAGV